MTLTFDPYRAMVMTHIHMQNQGQRLVRLEDIGMQTD